MNNYPVQNLEAEANLVQPNVANPQISLRSKLVGTVAASLALMVPATAEAAVTTTSQNNPDGSVTETMVDDRDTADRNDDITTVTTTRTDGSKHEEVVSPYGKKTTEFDSQGNVISSVFVPVDNSGEPTGNENPGGNTGGNTGGTTNPQPGGGTEGGQTGTTPTPTTGGETTPATTYIDQKTGLTVETATNKYIIPANETAEHRYKRARLICAPAASMIVGVVAGGPWVAKNRMEFVERPNGTYDTKRIRIKGGTNNTRVRTLDFVLRNFENAKDGYCDDFRISRRYTTQLKSSASANRRKPGRNVNKIQTVYNVKSARAEKGNGKWTRRGFRANFIHKKGHYLYRVTRSTAALRVLNPLTGKNEVVRVNRVNENKRTKF